MAVNYTITPGLGAGPIAGTLPFSGQVNAGVQTIQCNEAGHAAYEVQVLITEGENEEIKVVMTPIAP